MSTIRPECRTNSHKPVPSTRATLSLIYGAVRKRRGLIHGKLHDNDGRHCAMGCFFNDYNYLAAPTSLIDEVAAVNDSIPPTAGKRERRAHVLRWLEWKLGISP